MSDPRTNVAWAIHAALKTLRLRSEGVGHAWTLSDIHRVYVGEYELTEDESRLLSAALEMEAGNR